MAYPAWFKLVDEETGDEYEAFYEGTYYDVSHNQSKAREIRPGLRKFFMRYQGELVTASPLEDDNFRIFHLHFENKRLKKVNL